MQSRRTEICTGATSHRSNSCRSGRSRRAVRMYRSVHLRSLGAARRAERGVIVNPLAGADCKQLVAVAWGAGRSTRARRREQQKQASRHCTSDERAGQTHLPGGAMDALPGLGR